jgi:hypothetical protein
VTRVETAHGSFDAPDGWLLEGSGAADGPIEEGIVRNSIVVSGDLPIEGRGPADYIAMQQVLLPEVLTGYAPLEARALSDDPSGPWLLRHRFQLEDEPALLQWQVYFFEPDRVGILTATGAADAPGALQSHVFRAMGTFAFPRRGSAEDRQLHDHAHHDQEHQGEAADHQ